VAEVYKKGAAARPSFKRDTKAAIQLGLLLKGIRMQKGESGPTSSGFGGQGKAKRRVRTHEPEQEKALNVVAALAPS